MIRLSRVALACCALLLIGASSAEARIFVGPNSPAGQEYAEPDEQARQQGAGNEDFNAAPGAGQPAPSFGRGITQRKKGANDELNLEQQLAVAGEPVADLEPDSGGFQLLIAAIACAALALAGGLGLLLRRTA